MCVVLNLVGNCCYLGLTVSYLEGGSVNRCSQVGNFFRKVGYGKLGRGHWPISTARGNM
jgi:hypothetical protein